MDFEYIYVRTEKKARQGNRRIFSTTKYFTGNFEQRTNLGWNTWQKYGLK